MTSKTATNQNGHMIMVIDEHLNKYLSLNKLGIIKSRTETMPKVHCRFSNEMPYINSPLITVTRNVYAVKLNDAVVYRPCMEGTKRYRTLAIA